MINSLLYFPSILIPIILKKVQDINIRYDLEHIKVYLYELYDQKVYIVLRKLSTITKTDL